MPEGMFKKFVEQSRSSVDARNARSVRERYKMGTYLREADPVKTGTLLASFFNIPPKAIYPDRFLLKRNIKKGKRCDKDWWLEEDFAYYMNAMT